jgi:type I restriction-modification system DNA methylase subunit
MANERKTDLFISKLLDSADIKHTPNESHLIEVNEALKTASKKLTGKKGYPEFVAQSGNFILVIEDKDEPDKQVLFEDSNNEILATTQKAIEGYAENGALHYARHIVKHTNFKKIFAFGCTGGEKRHTIRPIFVDENRYKLLPEVENFENFSAKNIEKYYKEQVLGETPQEALELQAILNKSKDLHEALRNYGSLGDKEKPLVVSALLLVLQEESFNIDLLTGDNIKTDGQKIFDSLSTFMDRSKVKPDTKKQQVLTSFTIVKSSIALNEKDDRLGKTPIKYFAEYIKNNVNSKILTTSTEDILGRFYGEFMRYTGGDGQSLGIVLTPRHITELFTELIDIKPSDIVFDPCCGTGGFLVAAMQRMLEKADTEEECVKIKEDRIHGIEVAPEMFAIATTNMILRGDGKSNLEFTNFLKQPSEKLREKNYTVGFINPPYSQAKGKDTAHLSEINFIKHLLDSLADGGRCVAIVPQSTMVGKTKEDRLVKAQILKNHTLEGVITLNKNTFYGIGTNPCIAVFTAHKPHSVKKYCKFINYDDDGFVVKKHIGLVETERAKSQKAHLLDCWLHDKPAETKFMVKTTVEPSDEWLHSFYYFNDEMPTEQDFEKTVSDYLTFEFSMIMQNREYLFENEKRIKQTESYAEVEPIKMKKWSEFEIGSEFSIKNSKAYHKTELKEVKIGGISYISRTNLNNGIESVVKDNDFQANKGNTIVFGAENATFFYQPNRYITGNKMYYLKQERLNKYSGLFVQMVLNKSIINCGFGYAKGLIGSRVQKRYILLPTNNQGQPDYEYMESYIKKIEYEKLTKYLNLKLKD